MSNERPPIIVCKTVDEIVPVIRYELKLSGMTQQELADHLGVAYVTASRLLNSRTPFTLEQLYKVLALLGIGLAIAPPKGAPGALNLAAAPEKKRKTPVDHGVDLEDLLAAGKVELGGILTAMPESSDAIAEVGIGGTLILEDGSEYTSPSTAAKAIRGTVTNGWLFWGLNGRSLRSLRDELMAKP